MKINSNKFLVLLLVVILLSMNVLACQYTEIVTIGEKEVSFLYVNGERIENPLEVKNFVCRSSPPCHFEVHNKLDVPVNVTVKYVAYDGTVMQSAEIQAHNFITFSHGSFFYLTDSNPPEFIYNKNNYSEGKWINVKINEERCEQCRGVNCSDDGDACTSASTCGGGYCVLGKCNHKNTCYNDDCNCGEQYFQCLNNRECAKFSSVPSGSKPICSVRECISGYIDINSGECRYRTGETCVNNWECETNHCVMGKCSANTSCYGGICPCSINEVQCPDNTRCVGKDTINLGAKPVCNVEECKSEVYKNLSRKYVDDNGLCATHPDITNKMENDRQTKLIVLISIIVGLFILGLYVLVFRLFRQMKELEKEKQITMDKSLKVIEGEIQKINLSFQDLDLLQDKIKKLELQKEKTKKECDEILNLKKKYADELENVENEHDKIMSDLRYAKVELERKQKELNKASEESKKTQAERDNLIQKRKDIQELREQIAALQKRADRDAERLNKTKEENSKIINEKEAALIKYRNRYGDKNIDIDDEGYLVFTKGSKKRLHVWIYEKRFGLDEGQIVHHIDANRCNADEDNLVALSRAEHKKINHANIHTGDWEGGINEIRRALGWQNDDFPEHIREHLKKGGNN